MAKATLSPVMNGMELYRHLEKVQPELASKVIFISGDVLGEEVKTFLTQVDKHFLPKPFTLDELKTAVIEALN